MEFRTSRFLSRITAARFLFLTNTSHFHNLPGQAGHSYAFFSTARDLVGNVKTRRQWLKPPLLSPGEPTR